MKKWSNHTITSVTDRIMTALQMSHSSLLNLRNELKKLEEGQKAIQQKLLHEQERPYVLA